MINISADMSLHSDSVIVSPAQDELGRKNIVELIVKAIKAKAQTPHAPLTIGIYGAWGEGKTSTMRMIEHELRLNGVSTRWFDSWSFSDEKQMLVDFFATLASFTFPGSPISGILTTYRDLYLNTYAFQANSVLSTYQANLARCIPFNGSDLHAAKKKISEKLKKENQHLVVFIDDVDRLDAAEVQTLFKLIRQIADFENLIYVIGLDPNVVSIQLGGLFGENEHMLGREFLEKMINVPIVLPAIKESLLEDIIWKEVGEVWKENSIPFTDDEMHSVATALLPILRTKRAITRYVNQLSFIVPSIGVETEFVDLCLLEALKYLDEKGWAEVYYQKTGLLKDGNLFPTGDKKSEEENRVFSDAISKILAHYPKKWTTYVRTILEKHLFPQEKYNWDGSTSKRINNEKFFRQYFIAGIPDETIPRADVLEFSDLLRKDLNKAIKWINEKQKQYTSAEIERSACLSLDIIRDQSSSEIAAKLTEVFAFSSLAEGYGYYTIGNPSSVDRSIYAYIIPNYMLFPSTGGYRIFDMDMEVKVLSRVFKSAPLNFCMCLFSGVYSDNYICPKDNESELFEIIKGRVLSKGEQEIFRYSFPIKRAFFQTWKEENDGDYVIFWKNLLCEADFDLGQILNNWLEAVSPQEQLSEIEAIADLLSPVAIEVKDNISSSKHKEDKLVKYFIWNSGLFEVVADDNNTNNDDIMKKIEIFETEFYGEKGKKVKMAFLRAVVPSTDVKAVNVLMDNAVIEYVQSKGYNVFTEVNTDTPNYRIIINDLNDVSFKPYNGEHL